MNGGYMGNAQPPVILGQIWQSMLLRAGGGFLGMRKGLEGREMCRKKPSQALMHGRHVIRQLVAQHHALNPRVYGSVLRQEDKEDSDLDILVDPTPETTLFDLGGLQETLFR
ncbi:nucleotidyltransferase family protein [Paenirhodobacter ferrireducens]|uniref:nucleotidyltransferase family protein n=1 Tax=Paenirhodobacter ferrireducens TaxID=1215032 RepID=UPI0019D177DA|nr:hypothetical protein [Sinirhodobacter ferrireducens]